MHTYADAATLVHWTCYMYFYHIHPSFYIIKLFLNYKLQLRKGAQNILESYFLTAETIKTYLSKHDHMRLKSDTGQSDCVAHSAWFWEDTKDCVTECFFKNGGAGYSLSVCLVIFILHNVRMTLKDPLKFAGCEIHRIQVGLETWIR